MKTLNPNVYPHGGYYFLDSDGARLFGQTWQGVIARVIAYRKRAGLPPGDPPNEVVAQACQRNPVLCRDDNGLTAVQTKKASLKTRVIQWLNKLKADKWNQFVDTQLARDRAQVCAGCPKNTSLPGGCASCKAAVKVLREEIIQKRFQDGRLHACEVLGEDLPTTVHLESQTVDNPELPGCCWRRRSI
jgi:hypothetical protein